LEELGEHGPVIVIVLVVKPKLNVLSVRGGIPE